MAHAGTKFEQYWGRAYSTFSLIRFAWNIQSKRYLNSVGRHIVEPALGGSFRMHLGLVEVEVKSCKCEISGMRSVKLYARTPLIDRF